MLCSATLQGENTFTQTMAILAWPRRKIMLIATVVVITVAVVLLAAIRSAKKSINFETYIYWSGDIGREFAQALAERARQGVKVHVLLDWVGSAKVDDSVITELKAAGVEVRKFHPPHWSNLGRLNNRTHRKLLVVDGHMAFTGGVGIAPQWTGHAQDPEHWRDTHVQVQVPVVAQMQAVFLDNWVKVTGDVLHGQIGRAHV